MKYKVLWSTTVDGITEVEAEDEDMAKEMVADSVTFELEAKGYNVEPLDVDIL